MQNDYEKELAAHEVAVLGEKGFGKALAAAIMSGFPITSIIAIFMGRTALKTVNRARDLARRQGISAGGKCIAARALSIYGIASGAYMTLIYAMIASWIVLYVAILGISFVILMLIFLFLG